MKCLHSFSAGLIGFIFSNQTLEQKKLPCSVVQIKSYDHRRTTSNRASKILSIKKKIRKTTLRVGFEPTRDIPSDFESDAVTTRPSQRLQENA